MTSSITPPTEEAQQAVIKAADVGFGMAGGDKRLLELVKTSLQGVGAELARQVRPGERANVFVPVAAVHDGKSDPGALLLLDDRVVIAWIEGTFRPKQRSVTVALADISNVSTGTSNQGRFSPYEAAITFLAGGAKHEFVLASRASHDRLTMIISSALSGALTFTAD